MLFLRRSLAPVTLIVALAGIAACGGAAQEAPATDSGASMLAGTDVLEVSSSGGMPSYCSGTIPTAPWSDYRVDLAALTLRFDEGGGCAGPDGGVGPQSGKDVTLTVADRDALVAAARALTLETVQYCGADAPTRRVTVTHADGTREQHAVNDPGHNQCRQGEIEFTSASFDALGARLAALVAR